MTGQSIMAQEVMGYLEASDITAPEPGDNRSAVYRHCFEVRRREMRGEPWPAPEARRRAILAYQEDGQTPPSSLMQTTGVIK